MEAKNSNVGSDFDALLDIVQLCREIELISMKFYSALELAAESEAASAFWRQAALEEREHMEFWSHVISLAKKGHLPQVFDNPEEIRDELLGVAGKALELLSELPSCDKSMKSVMTMAFRVEFYCLHGALAPIFSLMGEISPCASYKRHLQSFIDMYKLHCGRSAPELQLLGETIQRLWTDNLRLSRQCYFDELSGLLNRRGFYNSARPLVSLARRRRNPVSMLLLDVDNFKSINDSLGHAAGDQVLRGIAKSLKASIRDSDIPARYGGDEFMVFCPDLTPSASRLVAEKAISAFRKAKFNGVSVAVSIGAVECVPQEGSSPDDEISRLLKAADILLYEAKGAGRDRVAWRNLDAPPEPSL